MTNPRVRAHPEHRAGRLGLALVLCSLWGAVSAACPGALEDPERFTTTPTEPKCSEIVAKAVTDTCLGAGCHVTSAPAGELDLEKADFSAELVGKEALGCAGSLLDPANPRESVFYQKLTNPPCGGAMMPLGRSPLSDEVLDCVLEWIAEHDPI